MNKLHVEHKSGFWEVWKTKNNEYRVTRDMLIVKGIVEGDKPFTLYKRNPKPKRHGSKHSKHLVIGKFKTLERIERKLGGLGDEMETIIDLSTELGEGFAREIPPSDTENWSFMQPTDDLPYGCYRALVDAFPDVTDDELREAEDTYRRAFNVAWEKRFPDGDPS